VARGFEHNVMASSRAFGLPQFRFALVPDPITGLPPEKIEADVRGVLDRIIDVLTIDIKENVGESVGPKGESADVLKIEASGEYAAVEKMNVQFLERDWSDGLPLIPPTPEKVTQMLKGTTLKSKDLITVLAPGNGLATVEKIAINAVMA